MIRRSFDDVTVIVRECGERTRDRCVGLLTALCGRDDVTRVAAADFATVLRRSLEAGLAAGRRWTLCIDADVLPMPALAALVSSARRLEHDVFAVQGLVVDKLLLCRRPAGNHLYRTRYIEHALPLIGHGEVRPETAMIQAMAARGYGLYQARTVVGLHDHQQYLADLYGKAWLHGHKHSQLGDLLVSAWQARAAADADYRVALAAFAAARSRPGTPRLARSETAASAGAALRELGLDEKPPLAPAAPGTLAIVSSSDLPTWVPAVDAALERWFEAAVFPPGRRFRRLRRRLLTPLRAARRLLRMGGDQSGPDPV